MADVFTVEDFEGVCMANTSTSLTLPGEVGAVESLCEAYLLWNLLPEAVGAFKLRLHCQLLLLLRGAKESCPQLLRRLSDTVYKLALCYYRCRRTCISILPPQYYITPAMLLLLLL